jgi:hypothetical protein
MEGAPSLPELAVVGALFVGGVLLMLIAWRLLTGYFHHRWSGFFEPSRWQLLWTAASAAGGGASLWVLWRNLEHIATRMGVGVAVLIILLLTETRSSGRGRR